MNVTDRRQTDGRTTTYSEPEREFTFGNNCLVFVVNGCIAINIWCHVYICCVCSRLFCSFSDELYDLNSSVWDIHVVTSALKLFFRELREPVISHDFCDSFLTANGK